MSFRNFQAHGPGGYGQQHGAGGPASGSVPGGGFSPSHNMFTTGGSASSSGGGPLPPAYNAHAQQQQQQFPPGPLMLSGVGRGPPGGAPRILLPPPQGSSYGASDGQTASELHSADSAKIANKYEVNIKSIIERLQEEARLAREELLSTSLSSNMVGYMGEYKPKEKAFHEFLHNSTCFVEDGRSLFRDWQVSLAGERLARNRKLALEKLHLAFEEEVGKMNVVQRQVQHALDEYEHRLAQQANVAKSVNALSSSSSSLSPRGVVVGAAGGRELLGGESFAGAPASGSREHMLNMARKRSNPTSSAVEMDDPTAGGNLHQATSSSPGGRTGRPQTLGFGGTSSSSASASATSPSKSLNAMQPISPLQQQQLQQANAEDVQMQSRIAAERQQGINRIVGQVSEVQKIFKDLAHVVSDQGEQILNIEHLMASTADNVESGAGEVSRLNDRRGKRDGRRGLAVLLLALLAATVLVYLVCCQGYGAG